LRPGAVPSHHWHCFPGVFAEYPWNCTCSRSVRLFGTVLVQGAGRQFTQFDADGGGDVAARLPCSLQWTFDSLGREITMAAARMHHRPTHAPAVPHEDPKFLQSTPARPLRILAEYLHPLAQLRKEGIGDTIVMFGSARIEARETCLARL